MIYSKLPARPMGLESEVEEGRPWREDVVLALAAHVERELGGYRKPEL